jgi:hypothetical protein
MSSSLCVLFLKLMNFIEVFWQAVSASTSDVVSLSCTLTYNFPASMANLAYSIFVLLVAAFIPLWIIPTTFGGLAAFSSVSKVHGVLYASFFFVPSYPSSQIEASMFLFYIV